MRIFITLIVMASLMSACTNNTPQSMQKEHPAIALTAEQANRLASLPLKCVQNEYPNKLSQTLASTDDLGSPKELHPAFYGCFDWHSSVHGHWLMVRLLKLFPDMESKDAMIARLTENITAENIHMELAYFMRESEKSFERTYGWAWLLKLAEELHTWDTPLARELEHNLQPLTDYIVFKYNDFLPRLYYPIRVGEHTNTAFGLSFAYDYAVTFENEQLKDLIRQRALDFYGNDTNAPLRWEPSGYDFLSPTLQEADIMRKILPAEEFAGWLSAFLPELQNPDFQLEPAVVSDRTDGKLVHLDGLNFSRAWCFYGIANHIEGYEHLRNIANAHIHFSLSNITDGDYMGEHWLASFALYALTVQ